MGWIEIESGVWARETDNPTEVVVLADVETQREGILAALALVDEYIEHSDTSYEEYLNRERELKESRLIERLYLLDQTIEEIRG